MVKSPGPTERDRYWLDHEAALARSGQTAKAYAAAQDLSFHALYQARKRLRALGLLASRTPRRSAKPVATKPLDFERVEVARPVTPVGEYRLSFPNGVSLAWSGQELPATVIDLVERLTKLR
jgi:hypothetical protein